MNRFKRRYFPYGSGRGHLPKGVYCLDVNMQDLKKNVRKGLYIEHGER